MFFYKMKKEYVKVNNDYVKSKNVNITLLFKLIWKEHMKENVLLKWNVKNKKQKKTNIQYNMLFF